MYSVPLIKKREKVVVYNVLSVGVFPGLVQTMIVRGFWVDFEVTKSGCEKRILQHTST